MGSCGDLVRVAFRNSRWVGAIVGRTARYDVDVDTERARLADDPGNVGAAAVATLEPLGPEHSDAQVNEHHDGEGEQDALGNGHGPMMAPRPAWMLLANAGSALASRFGRAG
jgi:hypothetical protein